MLEHLSKHYVRNPTATVVFLDLTVVNSTGIGPETFAWLSPAGNFTGGTAPSASDLAFYEQHGFYVLNGGSDYILRPEVLESNFYAWRATGDIKYYNRALAAAHSIDKFLKVNNAFAGINDVRLTNSGFIDDTESFFFAEVLKYLLVLVFVLNVREKY